MIMMETYRFNDRGKGNTLIVDIASKSTTAANTSDGFSISNGLRKSVLKQSTNFNPSPGTNTHHGSSM